jgi:two-component system response regulator HydG
MITKLLIVEDEFIEANSLRLILKRAGYRVLPIASSVAEAIDIIDHEHPDMVVLDIYLKGTLTGIDLAKLLFAKDIPFVFLSANANRDIFIAARSTRPYGFLVKPFRVKDVLVMLDVALYLHQEKRQTSLDSKFRVLAPVIPSVNSVFESIVTRSKNMLNIFEQLDIVSRSNTSVLIMGENGTGKELVAHCIHQISPRKKMPFVVVNCATLPSNLVESELFGHEKGSFTGASHTRMGRFEEANGGTIFLDEVGELSQDLQIKFLRVLQQKEIQPIGGKIQKIDVRIVAATNRNLENEVAAGRFRIDLFYRLNVFPVTLPPLRDRPDDIPLLANHFIELFAEQEGKPVTGISETVMFSMTKYLWPGNIRELENVIRRSVLLTGSGQIDRFFQRVPESGSDLALNHPLKTMKEMDREHIIGALERCNWKVYGPGGAAEMLDINVNTLNSKIKKLGLEKGMNIKKKKI